MNKPIVLLLSICLTGCAEFVGATEPRDDAGAPPAEASTAADAASRADAPTPPHDEPDADPAGDASVPSRCVPETVEFEGHCCWVAREGECSPAECTRLVPVYANQTFCANPQLCCAD